MMAAVDIVVVGAGTSGIIAALTAARDGKRVALVETSGRLGGVAIYGLHRFVCGLFASDGEAAGDPLPGPVTIDFCMRLAGGSIRQKAVRRGRVWVLPFAGGAALQACAEREISQEARIRVYRRDAVQRVSSEAGRIADVTLASGSVLRTEAVVDCTGSAAVCRLCGAEAVWPTVSALAGYGFEVEGVDEQAAGALGLAVEVPMLLRRSTDEGRLLPHLAYTTYETGTVPGRAWVKMALPADSTDAAKADAATVLEALKKGLSAFRGARLRAFLPRVLPRETCHVSGEYVLTVDDVLGGRKFADGMVRNAWPVEYWDAAKGVAYRYLPEGTWHDIPLRCLRPRQGPANLLCAGAAISAVPQAAASIRVMGVCMALGESAASQCLT